MAYADGVVYAAYLDYPQYQTATGQDADATTGYDTGTGGLVALDVTTGKVLWDIKIPTLPVAAVTVANDVVFAGGIDGTFAAYDAKTGDQLWSYDADLGFNAPPAIAGDYLFVGAGFPKLAHTDPNASPAPTADPSASKAPGPVPKLFAFRIGGAVAQPSGGPTAEPTAAADQRGDG